MRSLSGAAPISQANGDAPRRVDFESWSTLATEFILIARRAKYLLSDSAACQFHGKNLSNMSVARFPNGASAVQWSFSVLRMQMDPSSDLRRVAPQKSTARFFFFSSFSFKVLVAVPPNSSASITE